MHTVQQPCASRPRLLFLLPIGFNCCLKSGFKHHLIYKWPLFCYDVRVGSRDRSPPQYLYGHCAEEGEYYV